jgi:predicted RNA binding protein YcfA (HicA-like mRNA interferase family)
MPRKKRDIRRDLRKAGFVETKGKGDHTKFRHPLVRRHVIVDGADGADAKPYDEINLRNALRELEEARRSQP